MKNITPIISVVLVVAVVAGAGAFMLVGNAGHEKDVSTAEMKDITTSQWAYVGGDVRSFGVTDSKTPITQSEMQLAWKTDKAYMDAGGGAWKVPSSAICVGDRVYYYSGYDSCLYCCNVNDGKVIVKTDCPSSNMFSMPLAFGEGKIFVGTYEHSLFSSVIRTYDSTTLEQLFVTSPVKADQIQGTITYNDGKIYFGTYGGDYACFRTDDTDQTRSDEVVSPLWTKAASGWYNATPAFFGKYVVLVERGFDLGGAKASMIDSETGITIDTLSFDREYCSSGATAYEGRVYIPLSRVIDRSVVSPVETDAKHLMIRSFEITPNGFDTGSEKKWESTCDYGGTQSQPVIWNDTIYVGGGGMTTGTEEPFWIIDIDADCNMVTRAKLDNVQTKGTAAITTAYATKENGYAVYIYLMEYGHVYSGEAADSTNGYADIFVIRDSKATGDKEAKTEIVAQLRPDPAQFCFQSFSISEDGHVLIKNDTTLFCYGSASQYTSADVVSAIDRFSDMASEGNVSHVDYQRILYRYESLSDEQKEQVSNYSKLSDLCNQITLKTIKGDVVLSAPKGCVPELPHVDCPDGKVLTGWLNNSTPWITWSSELTSDTTLEPVYSDIVKVTLIYGNGQDNQILEIEKNGKLPFINDPLREGYSFDGWKNSGTTYVPTETQISNDLSLEAVWLKVSQLSFNSDGGTVVTGKYHATYSKAITNLPSTFKAGSTFQGWFYGETQFEAGTIYPYEEPIVLKAKWSDNDTVTKDNGHGVSVSGPIAADSTVSASKLNASGPTGKAIVEEFKKTHTGNCDLMTITVVSSGIDGSVNLTVSVNVDPSLNGNTYDVYRNNGVSVSKLTGTVENGKLVFTTTGYKTSSGVALYIGIQEGLDITERFGQLEG